MSHHAHRRRTSEHWSPIATKSSKSLLFSKTRSAGEAVLPEAGTQPRKQKKPVKKRTLSAAAKKRQSERMKAYWASRRKAAKK